MSFNNQSYNSFHNDSINNYSQQINNPYQNEFQQQPQQVPYVGQPIPVNNYYGSGLNQQQYNPPIMLQPMQNNVLPQSNPIVVVNTEPNMVNIQYSSPEIIYCTAPVRSSKKHYNDGVGVNGIINALRQVNSELNLCFPAGMQVSGNFNLLSKEQLENRVIEPLVSNNKHIPSQAIKSGKVVYCCNSLQNTIRQYSLYLLPILIISTIILIAGYSAYLSKTHASASVTVLYITHILLWATVLLLSIIGIGFCKSNILQFGCIFALVNMIYGIVVLMVSGFFEFNNRTFFTDGIGIRLGVQIPALLFGIFTLILLNIIQTAMKRFLILIKELEETEFISGCCV